MLAAFFPPFLSFSFLFFLFFLFFFVCTHPLFLDQSKTIERRNKRKNFANPDGKVITAEEREKLKQEREARKLLTASERERIKQEKLAERERLKAEREQKRKEERQQRDAERERQRKEKEAERERQRLEREAEKERQRLEREEARRVKLEEEARQREEKKRQLEEEKARKAEEKTRMLEEKRKEREDAVRRKVGCGVCHHLCICFLVFALACAYFWFCMLPHLRSLLSLSLSLSLYPPPLFFCLPSTCCAARGRGAEAQPDGLRQEAGGHDGIVLQKVGRSAGRGRAGRDELVALQAFPGAA